jgi:hypothetical protein
VTEPYYSQQNHGPFETFARGEIEEHVFFRFADIAAEQKLIPDSTLKCVSSVWGHPALLTELPASS